MDDTSSLRFKLADRPEEFEAIHRLNYRTFVQEIPQHAANAEERLVDRFHAENTYAVCLQGEELVGMIAGRSQRPFSLDQKLGGELDRHLPPHDRVVEVRLLMKYIKAGLPDVAPPEVLTDDDAPLSFAY